MYIHKYKIILYIQYIHTCAVLYREALYIIKDNKSTCMSFSPYITHKENKPHDQEEKKIYIYNIQYVDLSRKVYHLTLKEVVITFYNIYLYVLYRPVFFLLYAVINFIIILTNNDNFYLQYLQK